MKMKAKLNANKTTTTEAATATPAAATNVQNSTNNKIWRINGYLGFKGNFWRFSFNIEIFSFSFYFFNLTKCKK